jgi:serine/threonine-protein kinase
MANPEDLGRYRLKRLLGRGAMGEVWEATDLEHEGNKVAVKIMHAADDELAFARSAFAREARLASLLRHPHVVAVHDAGEAAGTSFMVMDMVEGRSLRAISSDPSTTLADKLRWIRQIGDGLSAMHRAGLAHRDLKPENVIVRPDRSACIVDLGIAKWRKFDLGGERDPEDALMAELVPPPPSVYVPPETIAMELYDELGDQYAFGVLAYEILTGSPPTNDAPPLAERDDIPKAIAAALDRARSPERGDRWDAMDLLLDAIVDRTASKAPAPADAPAASPTSSTSPQPTVSVAPRPRVVPLVVGAGALVLVLAVAALVVLR